MKCKVCGKRFKPNKDKTYMVMEDLWVLDCITKPARVIDAVDCPRCGCQQLLGIRLAPFKPGQHGGDCDD